VRREALYYAVKQKNLENSSASDIRRILSQYNFYIKGPKSNFSLKKYQFKNYTKEENPGKGALLLALLLRLTTVDPSCSESVNEV
jgi:hypothetical protein